MIKKFSKLNENNKEYDSFIINVKYDVGYSDIGIENILTNALQKYYTGGQDIIYIDKSDYRIKNSEIELKLIDSKYYNETYEVIYNKYRDNDEHIDNEDEVFDFVKKSIELIKYYSYRSVYTMDKRQKADINIISITKKVN